MRRVSNGFKTVQKRRTRASTLPTPVPLSQAPTEHCVFRYKGLGQSPKIVPSHRNHKIKESINYEAKTWGLGTIEPPSACTSDAFFLCG